MAERHEVPGSSQSHNNGATGRAPLPGWQQLFEEPVQRMTGLFAQLAGLEHKALEQARAGIEESARLGKEALAYFANLSAEWRKMALEGMRQGAERTGARA